MTLFKSSDAFQQLEKNKKAFGREGRINLKTGETIE